IRAGRTAQPARRKLVRTQSAPYRGDDFQGNRSGAAHRNACRTRRDSFNERRAVITVVDYKLNNLRSLENTLRRLGHEVRVTSDPEDVRTATKLILPGVGAFGNGMRNLKDFGLAAPFIEKVNSGTPALGICLGMHLLFTESEEFGTHQGLDLLKGRVVKLP